MKTYVGIDNGVSGTIAVIKDGDVSFCKTPVVKVQDYTKRKKIISRLDAVAFDLILSRLDANDSFIVIERPMINPTRFTATESAIRCHEAMLILIERRGLPYQFCDSREWQSKMLPKGCAGPDLKVMSKEIGNRLFPKFADVNHPDRDALLIAEWARRSNL
jgi:hypothetical protein